MGGDGYKTPPWLRGGPCKCRLPFSSICPAYSNLQGTSLHDWKAEAPRNKIHINEHSTAHSLHEAERHWQGLGLLTSCCCWRLGDRPLMPFCLLRLPSRSMDTFFLWKELLKGVQPPCPPTPIPVPSCHPPEWLLTLIWNRPK